ncbi:hypothetical protein Pmani_014835 [Petrolisthes manimaculis]|uniref:Uncharacterized protein n=1 Tax=Petrolisthes manimaculis TaxID=1843537 RepID=A0AAE1UCN9_9EUCA|nr:hypothetical protein Pmani_014835 [Petrolisthes manimaculis]
MCQVRLQQNRGSHPTLPQPEGLPQLLGPSSHSPRRNKPINVTHSLFLTENWVPPSASAQALPRNATPQIGNSPNKTSLLGCLTSRASTWPSRVWAARAIRQSMS